MVQVRSNSPRLLGERNNQAAASATNSVRWMGLGAALFGTLICASYLQYYQGAGGANNNTGSQGGGGGGGLLTSSAAATLPSSLQLHQNQLRGQAISAEQDDAGTQCRFYLAESAIPHGGLGLYTAVDLQKGDAAQSLTDICLYVADTPDGTHFLTHSWAKDVWLGSFEGRNPRAACEGFATLFNSMPSGVQTSKLTMLQPHDNAGLQRALDSGAGAVSHYYGITSTATRAVAAGSELTIDYGDWEYDEDRTYKAPVRTVPWLRKHGMCIDHIRSGPAGDPGMGRGAFGARFLKRGTIVAPAPLQLFADRSVFHQQEEEGPEALFVNYCLSVGGTDLLLFPYGPGVNLINHSQQKANVELQWSQHSMNHANWLDLPFHQLQQVDYPGGLILDVVALRDISEGEELFLDYGASWQQAWEEHERTWEPDRATATTYVYPQDMDLTQPFKTVAEQEKDPYPSNLATVCWTPNWDRDEHTRLKWTKPEGDWPEGILFCNILKRSKKNDAAANGESYYEYEVSLNFDRHNPDRIDKKLYIDTSVPQSAIQFVDKPYQSDMHLPNAFRHPIELPKHLIPDQWTTPPKML